jgi:hypothetical protein
MSAVFVGNGVFFNRDIWSSFLKAQREFGCIRGRANSDEARRERGKSSKSRAADFVVTQGAELHIQLCPAGDIKYSARHTSGGNGDGTGRKFVDWAIEADGGQDDVGEVYDGENVVGYLSVWR